MTYFRGTDFSEGPAAAFLKTLSFGGDTRLKIAVPSPLKAQPYAIFHILLLVLVFFDCLSVSRCFLFACFWKS